MPEPGGRLPGPRPEGRELQNKQFERGQEVEWHAHRAAEVHEKDSQWLSKLLILGVGSQVLGRRLGVNVFAEAMNLAGRGANFIGDLSTKKSPVFAKETSSFLRRVLGKTADEGGEAYIRGAGGRLGDIDGVQDLAAIYRVRNDPTALAKVDKVELEELLRRRFAEIPRTSNTSMPRYLLDDVERVTYGDIATQPELFLERLGKGLPSKTKQGKTGFLEVDLIKRAISDKIIHADTIVDPLLLKTKGGRVLDARVARPTHLLETVAKSFDLANIGKNLASFGGSRRRFGVIGPAPGSKNSRVFIAGDTYEARAEGLVKTATGQTLGKVRDARHLAASLRQAQQEGKLQDLYGNRGYKPTGLWDQIQETVGVGPKFHERKSGVLGTLTTLIRTSRQVAKGEGVFFARPYQRAEQNIFSQLIASKVDMPELANIVGGAITPGKFAGKGTGVGKGVIGGTKEAKAAGIGFLDRMKAYAGVSKDLTLVRKEAVRNKFIGKEDLLIPYGRAGIPSLEAPLRVRSTAEAPTGVSITGMLDYTERAEHYAASKNWFDKGYDFANYLTIRLNSLASGSLLGVGFRPSGNLLGNMGRLAAIPAMYMTGWEGLKYADYASRQLLGIGPIEGAADLYTKARVVQQKAREASGIRGGADYIENALLPGLSVGAVGTAGAAFAGLRALEKTGRIGGAVGLAAAIYGLVGGPDVAMPSEKLERIYGGEEKVPIRRARFWGLGYQPFKGGKIDHFAPSWYAKLKTKPATTSIYGSEEEYWSYGSMLPTPSNFFGLGKIWDPYRFERKNYFERPYPVTGGMFEEVPIFGPILSDTVGSLIKPRKKMHSEAAGFNIAQSNISARGVPVNAASRLGIPNIPGSLIDIDRPDVLRDRMQKYANVGLEPAGIWKFALEMFGVKLDKNMKMASADNMTSIARMFYDSNIGGMFGETEFIRRFIMSDYGSQSKINAQINPIPNAMPRWLPGSLSENKQDRTYFYDFTRGDPYTKIMGGEYRLPGPGYESVNRLHSGVPGVYDAVDKFMVLSDIAPFSTAYYKAEGQVSKMNLDEYWQWKVGQSAQYREEKVKPFDFYEPDSMAMDYAARIGDYNAIGGPTEVIRKGWSAFMSEGLAQIPIVGTKFFPFRDPVDHYRKFNIEGDSFANWKRPVETIVRPAAYDVVNSNPVVGTIKGAALMGLAAGAFPGTGVAKYLNPVQAVINNEKAAIVGGAMLGAGATSIRMATTGNLTGGIVPSHVREEREVLEYHDRLKYAKYRALESRAMEVEDFDLASAFASQGRRTTVYGMSKFRQTGDIDVYARTLGVRERSYFEEFINVSPANRQELLGLVPDHMREVLEAVYQGTPRTSTKAGGAYGSADELTAEYFRDHALPDEDWIGWSPSIPDSAIQIKSIEGGINGISDNAQRFGFYPNQRREALLRFPFLTSDDIPSRTDDRTSAGIRLWLNNTTKGDAGDSWENPFAGVIRNHHVSSGPAMDTFMLNMRDNRRNDIVAFFQDVYR